ncbi:DUF983 domain-containing protein [Hoeflea sp. YIM 152468]|uniref:DUF983 domain-containing protein n=1 Tax=Hoeflea sp. YIM 152468 TaxID=3031759 RepID=UPI0023DC849F|nr:DUF983 domain-containing protein [Hoeflea sp. YIM 152468]MDF1607091.1 DUF983 domain-containing protein [Hoeflea sp. YIM 152468]
MLEYGGTTAHSAHQDAPRETSRAVKRGLLGRCPQCGDGKLFKSYLKPADECAVCGEELYHQRADDFPPYLAIFIVGHIVVAGFMMADSWLILESWQHLMIWIPISIVLCLSILPPLKGAVIGLQWALRMHGFGGEPDELAFAPVSHEDPQ